MHMPNGETSFIRIVLMLGGIGAVISLAKVLVGNEAITLRLIVGRTILGSGTSLLAGMALIHFPDIHILALVGVAAALGIMGSSVIEMALTRLLNRYLGRLKKENES
ncbi:TPA: holin [Yersinia enterocolitica]|nr:holin [Yersinia enterocolitica]HDL7822537.1 holin [Yersinia enterocolitica]HDL7830510.1 holin [Yersinia enterocolitica]HDL7871366.1 holin [Yersinia enterocolitica]HDL7885050.1 holin [Yersinia enterocolitica]HDL7892542.1 holin [Yersinia enterocolitica]